MAATSAPGELLMRGISSFGDSMSQGINQYMQLKKADAAATGQIEAYLQASGGQGLPGMSDDGKNNVQKLLDGKLTYAGKLQLLGELQTSRTIKEQDLAMQQKAQANAMAQQMNPLLIQGQQGANMAQGLANQQAQQVNPLQVQQAQLQLQNAQRQQSILNSYMGGAGGPQGPQGQGMPAPAGPGAGPQQGPAPTVPNAQVPQSAALQQYIGAVVRATGALPSPETMKDFIDKTQGAEKVVGYVYNGPRYDSSTGKAVQKEYYPVYENGFGGRRVDNSPRMVPMSGGAPGTELDPASFRPLGQPAPAGNVAPIPTKEQQEALASANNDLASIQQNGRALDMMNKAIGAYTTANPAGNRTNPVMGTNAGLTVRAALFGDTSGQSLKGATGNLMNVVLSGWKGLGAGRLSQNEFNVMTEAMPHPDDPNDTLVQKAAYMNQVQQVVTARANAYRDALAQGLAPGEASQAAAKSVPFIQPPDFTAKAARATPSGVWTPEKEQRLKELRAKLGQ